MPDGRVMVVGGREDTPYLRTVEIWDPATGTWSTASALNVARSNNEAIVLRDGTVLVVGGADEDGLLDTAEIYDPAKDIWAGPPAGRR